MVLPAAGGNFWGLYRIPYSEPPRGVAGGVPQILAEGNLITGFLADVRAWEIESHVTVSKILPFHLKR